LCSPSFLSRGDLHLLTRHAPRQGLLFTLLERLRYGATAPYTETDHRLLLSLCATEQRTGTASEIGCVILAALV
jgi:hypothetical protein